MKTASDLEKQLVKLLSVEIKELETLLESKREKLKTLGRSTSKRAGTNKPRRGQRKKAPAPEDVLAFIGKGEKPAMELKTHFGQTSDKVIKGLIHDKKLQFRKEGVKKIYKVRD